MRRLSITAAAGPARGGWILVEFLRESGFLVALLAVAVGVLQQLTSPSPSDDAAAAMAGSPVYGLGVMGDGRQLWVNRSQEGVALFDLASMAEVDAIHYRDMLLTDADVSTQSPALLGVTTNQEQIRFLRGSEFAGSHEWPKNDGLVSDIRVQADGRAVVVASASGVVATWTWNGAGFDVRRDRVDGSVSLVELSQDGRWAAMVADNESLILFDRATGRETNRWRTHNQHCAAVAFSPDGTCIATGGKDGQVRVWDRSSGGLVWEATGDILSPVALRYSANGRSLASGGFDKTVRVWNAADGHLLTTLSAHTGPIRALAFHPAGDRLYSGSLDGQLFEWSLATQSVTRRFH